MRDQAMPGNPRQQPEPVRRPRFVLSGPNRMLYIRQPAAPTQTFPTPKKERYSPRPAVAGNKLASVSAIEHPDPTYAGRGLLPDLRREVLLRKEVIQPHLPVRLPCYDFVPIASPTFDHSLRKTG